MTLLCLSFLLVVFDDSAEKPMPFVCCVLSHFLFLVFRNATLWSWEFYSVAFLEMNSTGINHSPSSLLACQLHPCNWKRTHLPPSRNGRFQAHRRLFKKLLVPSGWPCPLSLLPVSSEWTSVFRGNLNAYVSQRITNPGHGRKKEREKNISSTWSVF